MGFIGHLLQRKSSGTGWRRNDREGLLFKVCSALWRRDNEVGE